MQQSYMDAEIAGDSLEDVAQDLLPADVEKQKVHSDRVEHIWLFDRPFYIFLCDPKFCNGTAFSAIKCDAENFQDSVKTFFTNLFNNTGFFCNFNYNESLKYFQFSFKCMIGVIQKMHRQMDLNPRIEFASTYELLKSNQFNFKCVIGVKQDKGQQFNLQPVFELTLGWEG